MGAAKQYNNRTLRTAVALLLCVAISSALLFSRMVGFAMTDHRQYIPLTRTNGATFVQQGVQLPDGEMQFRSPVPYNLNSPVLLAAGPVHTANWFQVKDDNAVWKGNTQVEIFRMSYKNGQNQITVNSGRGDKVIAPGTENSYTFALENTGRGNLEYTMSMKAYVSLDGYPIPVEAKVTRDIDSRYLLGSASDWADVLDLNTVKDSGTLRKGYVMPYTLTWQWPFETDDAYDTELGNLEEDLTLTIVIETYATGTDSTPSSGIPQTGDTSGIALAFGTMVTSLAALLLILLLTSRQKREEANG